MSGKQSGKQHDPSPRRFPPPWTVEQQAACFVVRDHNGQQLAYVYLEDEFGRLQQDGDEPKTLVGGGVIGPPL
jgi:hypothetical protein